MSTRKSKARKSKRRPQSLDAHGQVIARTIDRHVLLMQELARSDAPLDDLDRRIDAELLTLQEQLAPHRPERVVELARIACLPWSMGGEVKPDTEGGATKVELVALLAQVLSVGEDDGSASDEAPNSLYEAAHRWAEEMDLLIHLAQTRELLAASQRKAEKLDFLAYSARSSSVWIRSTSYPDMVEATYDMLFGQEQVRAALTAQLGFDASDAIAVLTELHNLQVEAMNGRLEAAVRAPLEAWEASGRGETTPSAETRTQVRAAHNRGWQPTADVVAFTAAEVASALDRNIELVQAVLDRFSLDLELSTARDVLDRFIGGDNPLRTNPVIRTSRGTFMLVHDALVLPAIREYLEQELKALPEWEAYQKWRATLLENLARESFEGLIPGATTYTSFEYFVPATASEANGTPTGYTKRVEGDILLILDDVAIIVEAKAVAINPESRAGETRRLRRDLNGIITKAAEQASRLQQRIQDDRGLRLDRSGWLDLSHVREIHTVALSLEDLSGVATATSELVEAEILDADRIPWVVSIHDLQVITQLVDRPAEFLLYLRRRRDPQVSLAFTALDELDLFLYFYEAGLHVVPDPLVMAAELPYVASPRPADVRRRKEQGRTLITSRTDPLDAWHYASLDPEHPGLPKPALKGSPMTAFVDELQARESFGWLSTGATLLSGSTKAQADMCRIPAKLLAAPRSDGTGRTQTVLIGTRLSNAWLLVWMTKPPHVKVADVNQLARRYVRAKKYQLKFTRGVVFIYDEPTSELVDVVYDGALPTPDPEMDREIENLFPPDKVSSSAPPNRHPAKRSNNKTRKRR